MSNVQIYVIHHDGENYPTFESENITVSHFGIPPEVHALLIRKSKTFTASLRPITTFGRI